MHIKDAIRLIRFDREKLSVIFMNLDQDQGQGQGQELVVEGWPEDLWNRLYNWWVFVNQQADRMVHILTWLEAPIEGDKKNVDYLAYLMGKNGGQLVRIPAPGSTLNPTEAVDLGRISGILQGLMMGSGLDPKIMNGIIQKKVEEAVERERTRILVPGPELVKKLGLG